MATDQDDEHLNLLAIFHYVVGGLSALFACIPLIHLGMGIWMVMGMPGADVKSGQPPPAIVGWFFIAFASVFILFGWSMAVAIVIAGRNLARRRRLLFCQVMAGIECLFMPFGTVLGVLTLIVLNKPGVKARFALTAASPGPA